MRLLILGITLLFFASCKKAEVDTPQIIIDVYSSDKVSSVRPHGEFISDPLDLYLEGTFIGSTPMKFYQADLDRLNLPGYEQVDTSPESFWLTWDNNGHGRFEIVDPKSPDKKRLLEFRTKDRDNPEVRLFSGSSRSGSSEETKLIFAHFPRESGNE